ncbi:MAG: tRNA uridine-5-carboxymethylaminomethyl(34) synthesis GTPase MnmE [Schwartzia sp.]|nr:tRNA uridine-5-carboxymethylaminomethyl(34) synthesis GTPase MnmE [Schwartzia sp. (in: firmicutes)]
MQQGDTISAIATPRGEGGIGIIRISGENAVKTAAELFVPERGGSLEDIGSYHAAYGKIMENGRMVDEALALIMRAPHSYTKEDVVELQCHGGSFVLRRVLELTFQHGARPAEPGEFTKRAFLNGRLDLTQAQAVMDLIEAKTDSSLRMAAGHLEGMVSSEIKGVRHDILEMIAHLEASIDFPEDDIDDVVIDEVRTRVSGICEKLERLVRTAHTGKILREGLETAIIGRPNVGKSSLLNALLHEERAIVTDIPGTTRDSIEEYANVGGVPLHIIDTAGIRATEDRVEQMGVERSKGYIEKASLVLVLFDASSALQDEDREIIELLKDKEALILLTKEDLKAELGRELFNELLPGKTVLSISTKSGFGLEALEKEIVSRVYGEEAIDQEGCFVASAREAHLLRKALEDSKAVLDTIENGMSADFVVIDLRTVWEKLGEITGETVGEDIIDEIFRRFCLGK